MLKKDSWISVPYTALRTSGRCLPADEDTLIQYAAFLVKSIKYSSIKGYLAAVRHFHIRRGFALDLNKCLPLQLVCRGIKYSQGTSLTRVRLPITIMLWATMALAFFGFLRLGELTSDSQFSSETHFSPPGTILITCQSA